MKCNPLLKIERVTQNAQINSILFWADFLSWTVKGKN